jgi:hypothetical protein
MALRVEVQRRGEIAVKQAIRNEGRRKVSQVKRSEMAALGREYLAAHPELIPRRSLSLSSRWPRVSFGKRAQLALERNFQDTFSAEVPV